MNTTKLELIIIGDFLTGSFGTPPFPSPLKGGEGKGDGLRPECFSDPSARAAFELVAAADTTDAAVLQDLLRTKMGIEFCERAVAEASVIPAYATARLGQLARFGGD